MRVCKTGHIIADTVSDLIGELPDGDYRIVYGILRHSLFQNGEWFEIDRGFWGASHFDGNYRISFKNTQPIWHVGAPQKNHDLIFQPWRDQDNGFTLICPPTAAVCDFFKIDYTDWVMKALRGVDRPLIRHKGDAALIDWDSIARVVTFNSTIGVEALCRGIPVISDPVHSSIGSYTAAINSVDRYDRDALGCFLSAHQFKLDDHKAICHLINHYLSLSAGTPAKPSPAM